MTIELHAGREPARAVGTTATRTTGAETEQEPAAQSVVAALRDAALELLASLSESPTRLRLRAAGVDLDLDWRATPTAATPAAVPFVRTEPQALDAAPPATANGSANETGASGAAEDPTLHYVCAEMVGTFYRAPEPGARPFVVEGDLVAKSQQIGIVEAMKLMLPVEADRAGRIVAVLASDGQSVEYQERLLALAPVD